ncbi:MAG: hypothetical protein J6C13_04205 [Clostridia bacterium]|nr:hypothetical protein [Clostridia bacterium]
MTKQKITTLIVSCIIAVALVAGGITWGVISSRPQSGAITGTETSLSGYIGNLLTTNGDLDVSTYNKLITAVGALGSVSSTQNSANINSGTPVVFQMGTAAGNPVYWQVTYRTKDYLTIMMTRPYTVEYFNYDGKTYASGMYGGVTQADYDQLGNYSRSTLRQVTQQIYTDMNNSYDIFSEFVVSPSAMAIATGTSWQETQANSKYSSSYNAITNGLKTQTSTTNPHSFTWDSSVYDDKFWIPSFYELYNTSTSSTSFNGGLWGLSSQSYVGFSTASFLNSSVTTSYCWLRSGSL